MKALLILIIMALFTSSAHAAITVNTMANIQLAIDKQSGVTNYSDTSPGWVLKDISKLQIVGYTADDNVSFEFPATMNLTRSGGTETLTVNLVCRQSSTYVDKNGGSACMPNFSINSGLEKISIIPVTAAFSSNIGGSYSGSAIVRVNFP